MVSVKHVLCLALALAGCRDAAVESPTTQETKATPVASPVAEPAPTKSLEPVKTPAPAEASTKKPPVQVVFNPAKPPAGYTRCQAKECHTQDGRILTYKQVMAEIGATRMVGSLDKGQLPDAPDDVAAPPASAEKTPSGLASRVLTPGKGTVKPGATSTVQVHYSGWTTAGEAFDSSVARGRPAAFPLNGVIPGWQEALQLMVEGEKRRVWIPEDLAYKGKAGGPPGMLVFDVELLKIVSR